MKAPGQSLLIKIEILSIRDSILTIRVTDNGDGDASPAAQPDCGTHEGGTIVPDTTGNGLGLINISQRLRLHYGDHARIHIMSIPEAGTQI